MQDDILFSFLTVKESLMFAADLRLRCSRIEKERKVTKLLKALGLWGVRDTICGSTRRKTISGGERKRTAIGVELITDPSLIMLDEPTSGLDSFRATSIVLLLKKLAREKGKTIISTIHQPNSDAFQNFDRVIFLQDGYVVYQGLAIQVKNYFNSIGHGFKSFSNPADRAIALLSVDYPKTEETEQKIKAFADSYEKHLA